MPAHDDVLPAQPAAGVLHYGESVRKNLLQLGSQLGVVGDRGKLRLPFSGSFAQIIVGQLLQPSFDLVDLRDQRTKLLPGVVILIH
jgi:hypothetical protein